MAPIEFHIREKNTMEVNGYTVNCLVINIFYFILFCVCVCVCSTEGRNSYRFETT